MRSDDPRDPDGRDPSLFDDSQDAPSERRRSEVEASEPEGSEREAQESREYKHHPLFDDEFDEDAEGAAQELRYEGPITMDGHEEEYEDEGGGGGRLLVTTAIVIGAVIVIVAVAMMMKSGGGAESGTFAEDRPAEVAALEEPAPTETSSELPGDAGASIDYRAIPDAGSEETLEEPTESASRANNTALPSTPSPAPSRAQPERATTETAQAAPVAPPVPRPRPTAARNVSESGGGSVGELARQGRVREAAQRGRALLGASSASHTLQVLYSCEPANVEKAFKNVRDPELTVVPADTCYRVCFGTFDSHADASAAKSRVPSYFAGAGAFPKPLSELALR